MKFVIRREWDEENERYVFAWEVDVAGETFGGYCATVADCLNDAAIVVPALAGVPEGRESYRFGPNEDIPHYRYSSRIAVNGGKPVGASDRSDFVDWYRNDVEAMKGAFSDMEAQGYIVTQVTLALPVCVVECMTEDYAEKMREVCAS